MKDEFGPRANLYASARPSYPQELVQAFVSSLPVHDSVLDVACGSGQLSVQLAQHFDKVVAMDKSQRQLDQAPARNNIVYQLGTATQLPNNNNNNNNHNNNNGGVVFDAITCAQAYHWLVQSSDDRVFLTQARHILHPSHGRLGIFGYGVCTIASNAKLQAILEHFYYDRLKSASPPHDKESHWEIDRRLVDHAFPDLETYQIMRVVQRQEQVQTVPMTIPQFLNYIRTWSGLVNLQRHCATTSSSLLLLLDPMEVLHRQFEENKATDHEILQVLFPFFLIILKPVVDSEQQDCGKQW